MISRRHRIVGSGTPLASSVQQLVRYQSGELLCDPVPGTDGGFRSTPLRGPPSGCERAVTPMGSRPCNGQSPRCDRVRLFAPWANGGMLVRLHGILSGCSRTQPHLQMRRYAN